MDKYCKGCKYQGFRNDDQFETYGFCLNKNHQTVKFWKEVEECTYKFLNGLSFYKPDIENYIKERYLSCLMAQSVYEGNCPYKTEE